MSEPWCYEIMVDGVLLISGKSFSRHIFNSCLFLLFRYGLGTLILYDLEEERYKVNRVALL